MSLPLGVSLSGRLSPDSVGSAASIEFDFDGLDLGAETATVAETETAKRGEGGDEETESDSEREEAGGARGGEHSSGAAAVAPGSPVAMIQALPAAAESADDSSCAAADSEESIAAAVALDAAARAKDTLAALASAAVSAGPGVWVIRVRLVAAADRSDDEKVVVVEASEKRGEGEGDDGTAAPVLLRPVDGAPCLGTLPAGALVEVDGVHGDWLHLAGECAWVRWRRGGVAAASRLLRVTEGSAGGAVRGFAAIAALSRDDVPSVNLARCSESALALVLRRALGGRGPAGGHAAVPDDGTVGAIWRLHAAPALGARVVSCGGARVLRSAVQVRCIAHVEEGARRWALVETTQGECFCFLCFLSSSFWCSFLSLLSSGAEEGDDARRCWLLDSAGGADAGSAAAAVAAYETGGSSASAAASRVRFLRVAGGKGERRKRRGFPTSVVRVVQLRSTRLLASRNPLDRAAAAARSVDRFRAASAAAQRRGGDAPAPALSARAPASSFNGNGSRRARRPMHVVRRASRPAAAAHPGAVNSAEHRIFIRGLEYNVDGSGLVRSPPVPEPAAGDAARAAVDDAADAAASRRFERALPASPLPSRDASDPLTHYELLCEAQRAGNGAGATHAGLAAAKELQRIAPLAKGMLLRILPAVHARISWPEAVRLSAGCVGVLVSYHGTRSATHAALVARNDASASASRSGAGGDGHAERERSSARPRVVGRVVLSVFVPLLGRDIEWAYPAEVLARLPQVHPRLGVQRSGSTPPAALFEGELLEEEGGELPEGAAADAAENGSLFDCATWLLRGERVDGIEMVRRDLDCL